MVRSNLPSALKSIDETSTTLVIRIDGSQEGALLAFFPILPSPCRERFYLLLCVASGTHLAKSNSVAGIAACEKY